jgi:diguanylate cyclase (GGDEF)-like protein
VESAKTLSSTLDIDPLLNSVMKEVGSLVGPAELGLLFVWDENSEHLIGRSAFGCNEEVISKLHLESGEMIAGRVFREQRAWVSHDPLQITGAMGSLRPENYQLLETAGVNITNIQNVICVPLIAKGRGVGALFLTNVQDASEFPIDLLGALADQIALTLENSHLYEETKRLSATDPLTGLWNRRTIERRLRTEIRRHERGKREFSLLIVDVDRLKLFNDTHGHAVGDQVILTVASVLQDTCRETDDVGRHGGDEFTVIMPDSGADEALALAKRIIRNLDAKPFQPPEGDPVPVSVSIGGATYPADAQDADGLFMLADASLYQVKLRGGAEYSSQANPLSSLTTAPQPTIDAVRGLVATVDAKDNYTFRHSRTVTDHALQLAEVMDLSEGDKQALLLAGQLHDVGKIGIPTDVLCKPGRLTEDEYAIIREHPRLGHTILHQLPKIPDVLDAVLYHHERWDGTGYPDGLKGEEIPVLARILALADAYSAMTSTRPYRKALTSSEALQEIGKYADRQFDPKLAKMFVALKLSDPDPAKTDLEDDADPDLPSPLSQSE